jgi:hypothetical protein
LPEAELRDQECGDRSFIPVLNIEDEVPPPQAESAMAMLGSKAIS